MMDSFINKRLKGIGRAMGKVDKLSINVIRQFHQQLRLYIGMDGLVRLTDKMLIDALFGKVSKNSLNAMLKQCLHLLMDDDDR